jgi:2-C-methyl-D-erythritol 4-phosphate cytidylyltransferase
MPRFAVILPAAGASTRFGPQSNKLLATLRDGLPVIACTLEKFLARLDVELIVVAMPPGGDWPSDVQSGLRQAMQDPRVRRCHGGASRAQSVRNALAEVPAHVEWIAVHDAARPLVSNESIDRTIEAAVRYGAAVPALPVVPTVKQADGPLPAKVQRTVPRHALWAVQTPQVMRRLALASAYESCPVPLEQITDEAQLLELAGQDVWLVPGDERNIKITTPDDLRVARAYLQQGG